MATKKNDKFDLKRQHQIPHAMLRAGCTLYSRAVHRNFGHTPLLYPMIHRYVARAAWCGRNRCCNLLCVGHFCSSEGITLLGAQVCYSRSVYASEQTTSAVMALARGSLYDSSTSSMYHAARVSTPCSVLVPCTSSTQG